MCKRIYIFLTLVTLVCCEQNVTEYKGLLTSDCTKAYVRMFVTRRVPPRNYFYVHESVDRERLLASGNAANTNNTEVDVKFRIVGGKIVSITEVPYQVLYGRYCGGSLIAPQWVITAAHCKDRETFILAGSTQRSRAQKYRICAHFIHPLWNATAGVSHDYDYQLVLLETPVPVTPSSRPIAIGSLEDIRPGNMVAISGWGHLQFKKSRMQDLVRRVYVPVMADDECRALPHGYFSNITSRMFCAGYMDGAKDSCQGDSGGPAVINGKLVGIVSFGVSCAAPRQPGVYSKVPVVRDWIRAVTALPL
ncbi:PREDICTED: trypsin 3A1-like [Papilio xuthus]|uniref:trypsin n=2 Tax=Papilio xuthus TaxID=66420 RepID=A0AAJ7EEW4_PAPXU|nr:PREDICTED: trypsin 3A1-like [Papilio xuthus]